ncbi:uncharacterized protein LOC133179056 [Saccostrea echinata]|uniref:uncharacterized protein LOC133179056 n=1 Tax=Saccostrea echinata TaxID=191078 RepID=UPI002A8284E1|nr:uncharacterized protein LOC133179056 [Saccostrea echinata]
MNSFVVIVILFCGLYSDALAVHKTRVKHGDPYAELISKIKHYLDRRQSSPSSTYNPGTDGGSGFTPSPSPSFAPYTDSSVGPTPSPSPWSPDNSSNWGPGGNSSNSPFNLDSNLHCPILTQILWRRVLNFPRTEDMVDFITFYPDMFRPLVARTMKLLSIVDEPEVAALFLVRRFTQEVVERRLTCATAKYQQVIFYAITQEMKSTFRNDSLSSKLSAILHGFPRSMNLTHKIMFSLHGYLFYSLIDLALSEEFGELDNFVEKFYHYTEHRFREMKNTAMSPDMWTRNFQQEMGNQFMQNGRALRCTSIDEMKWNHKRIANETREGFFDMVETGYIHRVAYKMLSGVASEFYKNEWSTIYKHIFPFDQIIQILLDYTKNAMKVIENYEYNLFNYPLNSVETIFAKYLGPEQLQAFQKIITRLTAPSPPSPIPPLPTGSPIPDWNYVRNVVQESRGVLKNILTMLNSPTVNRDEISKLVTKVIANLDQLIQAGTKKPV